jgi:hypothetical protein
MCPLTYRPHVSGIRSHEDQAGNSVLRSREKTATGQPISKDWFEGFLQDLTDRFGGATSFLRPPDRVSGRAAAGRRKSVAVVEVTLVRFRSRYLG